MFYLHRILTATDRRQHHRETYHHRPKVLHHYPLKLNTDYGSSISEPFDFIPKSDKITVSLAFHSISFQIPAGEFRILWPEAVPPVLCVQAVNIEGEASVVPEGGKYSEDSFSIATEDLLMAQVIERRKKLPDPSQKEKGVSLWSLIKDNVGKDLTRVCLPVYFSEPISSLKNCFEDLEYSYLLDRAYQHGKHVQFITGETYEADYPEKGVGFFSEKVAKLFQKIQDMVEEDNTLEFVLIDEVESLAAVRKAALSGSEPSDSIRVVNALLTQMDKLKSSPNVIILTTSNITVAIGTLKNGYSHHIHFRMV
ncbi:hypothetical protein L2E82_06557 [Cichorium intybus]|uniref:Uncharacterized protein n=1 Tax=Cichorium intybus TaxID=13427 RepID=A0ACB9H9V7_CICIN|nr:hypothetical protein L2E82_06557 [Cichorium intybus]